MKSGGGVHLFLSILHAELRICLKIRISHWLNSLVANANDGFASLSIDVVNLWLNGECGIAPVSTQSEDLNLKCYDKTQDYLPIEIISKYIHS